MEPELKFVYEHYRFSQDGMKYWRYYPGKKSHWNGWKPSERGGATICKVLDKDGNVIAQGQANCSLKDSFVYRIGRNIARGRALKALRGT